MIKLKWVIGQVCLLFHLCLLILTARARRGNIGHFICRTAKATPTIRGGRSRLQSGHDLLVERQQHNQKKAQWIQARRKPGTDVPMTKASGGRPVRQTRKEVSKMAKVGCPRKYKSVKQMQEAIDAYFESCKGEPIIGDDGQPLMDKYGNVILIGQKPPTITGLALALGFTGRQALIDYQARPEFTDTVTRAKSMCEEYAEARLYDRDGANGAKFSLSCNFGWREKAPETDRQEIGVVLMPEVKDE